MFWRRVKQYSSRPLLLVKQGMSYRSISWQELGEKVMNLALSLSREGLNPDDKVGIIAPNRQEWIISDLATLACRAVVVPLHPQLPPQILVQLLSNLNLKILFLPNFTLIKKLEQAAGGKLAIEKIICFDTPLPTGEPGTTLREILKKGKEPCKCSIRGFEKLIEQGKAEELATFSYTEGVTGIPKAAKFTHHNLLEACRDYQKVFSVSEKDTLVSGLSLSCILERSLCYYFILYQGGQIAYPEGETGVISTLREVQPTILSGHPKFYQRLYNHLLERIDRLPRLKRKLLHFLLSQRIKSFREYKKEKHLLSSLKQNILYYPFLRNLKKLLNTHLRYFISNVNLPCRFIEFFQALGINFIGGYHLTEATGLVTANTESNFKLGTQGQPFPRVKIKTTPDGELLVKSSNFSQGYHQTELEEELSHNAWFTTGDLGYFDEDNFLIVSGRKDDIIHLTSGIKINPQEIELALIEDKYISNAVVFGNNQSYLVALIVPNFENLKKFAQENKISWITLPELVAHAKIQTFITSRIAMRLTSFPLSHQVKKFILLHRPLAVEENELTPHFCLRRQVIAEKFKSEIEKLYQEK
jgi:long-chain acyl-CoA synthetase